MKRAFLTILFFMSLLPCIVYAEELFLYISDGQWGYATDDGTVVIAASFSEATPFYNGVAKVRTSVPMDHYSLIDFQGNEITPPCYDIYEFDSAFMPAGWKAPRRSRYAPSYPPRHERVPRSALGGQNPAPTQRTEG